MTTAPHSRGEISHNGIKYLFIRDTDTIRPDLIDRVQAVIIQSTDGLYTYQAIKTIRADKSEDVYLIPVIITNLSSGYYVSILKILSDSILPEITDFEKMEYLKAPIDNAFCPRLAQ